MKHVLAKIDRLIVRFLFIFLTIERTRCGEPECRCKNHEVIGVSSFGWYTFAVFVLAMMLHSCWQTR